jgi:hypothetical protein
LGVRVPPEITPYGPLYQPQHLAVQLSLLAGAFLMSFWCGLIPRLCFGSTSAKASIILHAPFPLVLLLGYAGWAARTQAIGFELLGRSLIKVLIHFIFRRSKPDLQQALQQAMPSKDTAMKLLVRVQKAASSFLVVAIVIAFCVGGVALFIDSRLNFFLRPLVIAVPTVLWGWLLMRLGRRGYLMIPDGGD